MDLLALAFVACLASGLTLFSGFGLGTILTPAFALFLPLPLAVAATALVHFANNLFKFALLARAADWRILLRFALPAIPAALAGASVLAWIDHLPALLTYPLGNGMHSITPVKLLLGLLIAGFALLELSPRFAALAIAPRWLPLGGLLSGFFGGLSGNQGALRSAFLIRAGMDKEAFVATGVVAAVLVDISRLTIYGDSMLSLHLQRDAGLWPALLVATLAAFAGAILGKRLLHKVTLRTVQLIVAAGMLLIGAGLASGLL